MTPARRTPYVWPVVAACEVVNGDVVRRHVLGSAARMEQMTVGGLTTDAAGWIRMYGADSRGDREWRFEPSEAVQVRRERPPAS